MTPILAPNNGGDAFGQAAVKAFSARGAVARNAACVYSTRYSGNATFAGRTSMRTR